MGQRLVISVFSGEKRIATSYYHWSGYTGSAIEITLRALEKFKEIEGKRMTKLQRAVEILWATGARPRLCDFNFIYGRLINFKDMKFTKEQISAISKVYPRHLFSYRAPDMLSLFFIQSRPAQGQENSALREEFEK